MTPAKWLSVVGIGLLIIGVVVVATSNRDDRGKSHVAGTRLSAARPECPTVWDTIPFFDADTPAKAQRPASGKPVTPRRPGAGSANGVLSLAPVFADSLKLPGPKTNIPEFN